MEGLGQVIVGSGGEAFYCLFFVGIASQQNYVGEILREIAANFFAELYATDVGHGPVSDDDGRLVFCVEVEGFASVLGEDDVAGIVGKSVLDQFAVNCGVVRHQDF